VTKRRLRSDRINAHRDGSCTYKSSALPHYVSSRTEIRGAPHIDCTAMHYVTTHGVILVKEAHHKLIKGPLLVSITVTTAQQNHYRTSCLRHRPYTVSIQHDWRRSWQTKLCPCGTYSSKSLLRTTQSKTGRVFPDPRNTPHFTASPGARRPGLPGLNIICCAQQLRLEVRLCDVSAA
jgi:hypothetical protein